MTQEEIKEYLKRVYELEKKLNDEDKDTLQWLIFGYNECAKLLSEAEDKIWRATRILSKINYEDKNEFIPPNDILPAYKILKK